MQDQETQNKFIELRAQGWSFARIATELGVHRNTLINWSRKFQFQIQNLKALQSEAFFEECFGRRDNRWKLLADSLQRLEAEISRRDLADLSLGRLYQLAAELRAEIRREHRPAQFSAPVAEIPPDELPDQAMDWQV